MGTLAFRITFGRRLLPDVCGYPVSRVESVDVCSEGDVFRLLSLAHHMFLKTFCGLATLTKLNTEMRICRTDFGIVMLISNYWVGISARGLFFRPGGYHQLSNQCPIADAGTTVLRSVIKCRFKINLYTL